MNKRIKMTIIFRVTEQTGIYTWTDRACTRTLILTEEQSKLFFDVGANTNRSFDEVICEVIEVEETQEEKK